MIIVVLMLELIFSTSMHPSQSSQPEIKIVEIDYDELAVGITVQKVPLNRINSITFEQPRCREIGLSSLILFYRYDKKKEPLSFTILEKGLLPEFDINHITHIISPVPLDQKITYILHVKVQR